MALLPFAPRRLAAALWAVAAFLGPSSQAELTLPLEDCIDRHELIVLTHVVWAEPRDQGGHVVLEIDATWKGDVSGWPFAASGGARRFPDRLGDHGLEAVVGQSVVAFFEPSERKRDQPRPCFVLPVDGGRVVYGKTADPVFFGPPLRRDLTLAELRRIVVERAAAPNPGRERGTVP